MQNLNEKYEIYQKRLAKKASRLTSLMNDAKWPKLCEILEASGCKDTRVRLLSNDKEIALVCGGEADLLSARALLRCAGRRKRRTHSKAKLARGQLQKRAKSPSLRACVAGRRADGRAFLRAV